MIALLLVACDAPPPASEPFNDAAIAALSAFEEAEPDILVRATLQLEEEIAADLDLTGDASARSLTPDELSEADVADMDGPDRDPALTLPVALAALSPHAVTEHDRIPVLDDQTALEPFAVAYTRTFREGEACWPECVLRTDNVLTKDSLAMTLTFGLRKDWRAFELDDGRQVRVARGWMQQGATAESGDDRVEQSYALELWSEQADGTTLRLLVLWAESVFEPAEPDDTVAAFTVLGMNQLFGLHDDWIVAHPR